MTIRKFLLISLLTVSSGLALWAQSVVNVHGTVSMDNGDPQGDVNVQVSAFFADSSAFIQSVLTDIEGNYSVDIVPPDPNLFGIVDVSMVDCWGNVQNQQFFILNGNEIFEADFIYCEDFMMDSCIVIILEEWNPNGVIQLTAWTPPGSNPLFTWSTGDTNQTIFPQQPGTYCVVATFGDSCVVTDCIEVNPDTTEFCYGYIVSTLNNDGTYDLEAVAVGVAPFTYAWSTGDSVSVLQSVGPGTYCVDITDSTGCQYSTCVIVDDFNFCEVYIAEEPGGVLTAYGFGQPPVSYIWSTGDSTQNIFPAEPGLYCVTATDANGCIASSCYDYGWIQDSCFVYINAYVIDTTNVLVLQAEGYSPTGQISYLWNTGETTPIIYPQDPNQMYCVTITDTAGCSASACFDSGYWCYAWVDVQYVDTTTAVLSVWTDPIFGVPGMFTPTYLWSDSSTGPVLTVTESGEYCVTVTIGNNCETVACAYVDFENLGTECSAFVIQFQDTSGQWYAEAWAWGWGTFAYNWSNGDTNSVTSITGPNENICVTVSSNLGCEAVACADTLYWPCEALISVTYIDNQTAILTATVWNDPAGNATFLWDNGQTGPVITVNVAGTYCVTIESNGCTTTSCVDVYFWNIDSCGVWIAANPHPAGVEYVANAWGVPPFQYSWSNGSTEPSQVIDFGIHDLCVTVTDASGCVAEACNFPGDSCFVALTYGQGVIVATISDPLADIYWSTGDTGTTIIQVNAPGVYCATITTIFGCVATTCISVDTIGPNGGPFIINGYVTGDSVLGLDGRVDAFLIHQMTGEPYFLAGSSPIGPDGFYSIQNLTEGVYLVRAELTPGTVGAEDFMPTYYYASATWEHADPYVLPNWLPVTTDIRLLPTTGHNGGGVIGGTVTDPNQILAGEGDPDRGAGGLQGVTVLLFDQQGISLDYAITLEDGSFRFDNLPWGTYRISFDIPGLLSPDIWVTLSPANPEQTQITLVVDEGTVAVEEPTSQQINLYPNPANVVIHVPVPGMHQTYDIRLVDMQGKVVYAGSARNMNGVIEIEVGTLPAGLYVVHLRDDQQLYHGRFMKQAE